MKKIGLIGGMSWESSLVYYRLLNEEVRDRLKGFHSCDCLMDSVDFAEIERLQHEGNWEELCRIMREKTLNLQNGGAELIILCTNTMHLCSEEMTRGLQVPFLHIAEATGEAIQQEKCQKVALLGTKFTMEEDFYSRTLSEKYGIETLIPNEADRQWIHDCIYQELVLGILTDESKKKMVEIIEGLRVQGAEGVILGCTEIPLLIKQEDSSIPVFDTTRIHARKAVELALSVS